MQFEPNIITFDTTELTIEHPISPEGHLFSYYPSETLTKFHYHDFFEIGYCEEGTGIFNVNGSVIPFHDKCVSIIYEGQVHIAQSVSPEKSKWHFLYINLNCLFANCEIADLSFLKRIKSHHPNQYTFPSILQYNEYPEYYELVRQIILEAANFNSSSIQILQGLVYSLLRKHETLFRDAIESPEGQKSTTLTRELGPLLNFINENYNDPITIEELTNIAKMSKRNLQRKMIEYTGRSPMQYIHYIRLKYATALLLDKRNSVSRIAYEIGYNLSSFNRQFLKEFGMSPTEWRKVNL